MFNKAVKNSLNCFMSRHTGFLMSFEKPCPGFQEIPDWFIKNMRTNQVLVGYNQIDMWSGGHQVNRCGKYVIDDNIHRRLKRVGARMICVVAKDIPISANTKVSKMMRKGLASKRMCHMNDLHEIVTDFIQSCQKKIR